MKKAKCFSDIHYDIGKIDDKMYSSFTEHLGRSIYTGIYEPGHPNADEDGYRKDVMELVKELGVPVIRYPGGNFVSCYDWHDGIGPKEKRPKRMDYAWSSIETNQFGIDEFCQWAEKVGIEPMIAVNLGTGSIKDAGDLVEYCNHPGGTYWSDLRAQNGHPEPYNIKYWCLGNEMEGSWQAGHLSAEDYTKKALEAAKIMRWVDPSIKLVACGSSYEMLPTYMEWDRTMLTDLYNQVDYLSTHNYTMNSGQGTTNYLASYKQLDSHIKNSAKVIEYVKAKNHFDKVCSLLDDLEIDYVIDTNLVRGLDYYSHTVFEIISDDPKLGAGATVGGGGRYNGLIEEIGGPATPGVGFAFGMERLLLALDDEEDEDEDGLDCYIMPLGEEAKDLAMQIIAMLRANGFTCEMDHVSRGLKGQFKSADRFNAHFSIILGEEEVKNEVVNIKCNHDKEQVVVPLENILAHIENHLSGGHEHE